MLFNIAKIERPTNSAPRACVSGIAWDLSDM
jgi:hypothetical protein